MAANLHIVGLNVSGRRFDVLSSTINKIPGIVQLLTDPQAVRDETGALFIDRNPDMFQQVLDVVKTPNKIYHTRDRKDAASLSHELYMYGLKAEGEKLGELVTSGEQSLSVIIYGNKIRYMRGGKNLTVVLLMTLGGTEQNYKSSAVDIVHNLMKWDNLEVQISYTTNNETVLLGTYYPWRISFPIALSSIKRLFATEAIPDADWDDIIIPKLKNEIPHMVDFEK